MTVIYTSKKSKEFGEKTIIHFGLTDLQKKAFDSLKDYDVYDIEERSDGTLHIIAYKNEKLNPDVIVVTDEMKKRYPELKNVDMIQKVPYSKEPDWNDAMKYAKNLKLAGYSDWRLPTKDEASIIVKAFGKEMKLDYWYWTSTEYATSNAYSVDNNGNVNDYNKSFSYDCFCVR